MHRTQTAGKRKALYLRSGDVIPSEITSIDENGVSFRTATFREYLRPARQGQSRGTGRCRQTPPSS